MTSVTLQELHKDKNDIIESMSWLEEMNPLDAPRYEYLNVLLERTNIQIKAREAYLIEKLDAGLAERSITSAEGNAVETPCT